MTRALRPLFAVLAVSTSAFADEITFEKDIEFARAGGESLQLNLARPKSPAGKIPAILYGPRRTTTPIRRR